MKTLYTLAYPTLSGDDALRIDEFRRRYDPRFGDVQAHFTMVFGCTTVDEDAYSDHVRAVSRATRPIQFTCRYAMLGSDNEAERAYVFLVPDEGYSGLSRLHDALYRGPLAESLRFDIPFVPHITIGASADGLAAKRLCDDMNAAGLDIRGAVNALTMVTLDENKVCNLTAFGLTG